MLNKSAVWKMKFVPILYRRPGRVAFLALLAERKINNLRVINTPVEFDSVPGHHFNGSEINKLLTGSRLCTSCERLSAGRVCLDDVGPDVKRHRHCRTRGRKS